MSMMNRVKELVEKQITAGEGKKERRQVAEQGLAQKQGFVRMPIPSPFSTRGETASKRDVEFAKAMIIHHQGALDMCHEFLDNKNVANKYLSLLCVDILADQKREIDFMTDITHLYTGNPDDVKIDPSMIHGMEGMMHGGHTMKATKTHKHAHSAKGNTTHEGMIHPMP
jgi:uncharacterized protein (DUF305 family)